MKFLKPLLLLGMACFALFVAVELIVRLFFPVPMEPPGGILLTNEIPGIKESVSFDYNGEQLRTLGWTEKKKSDSLRILAVGGNATSALLQSAPDAWWGQLASQLAEATGRTVEVAAPAETRGGFALPSVAAAEEVLQRQKVDLVIGMFGFMDAMATPGDAKFSPAALDRLRKLEPVGIKYQIAKLSHLARMVRNSRTAKSQRARQSQLARPNYYRDFLLARGQYVASRPLLERFDRSGDDPLKNYLLGIEALAQAAEENGAKLLMVGEPTIYKSTFTPAEAIRLTVPFFPEDPKGKEGKAITYRIRPLAVESELQRFYGAAAERCDQLGVGWLNLQGEIPRFPDYFVTETYLTDQGARRVAEKLLPPVAALLGLDGVASAAETSPEPAATP